MPSTYSDSLRLELMATGEKSNTWGGITNTNLGTLLEQAIAGVGSVTHDDNANYTLTAANGASDEARNAVLVIGGTLTAARNVVCPAQEKVYVIKNATAGGFAVTLKTSAGTGISVANGKTALLYCDGTNVVASIDDLPAGSTIGGEVVVVQTRTLTAGNGLTGGGDLSADRTLTVGAGAGITVSTNDVALDTGSSRNVDHSAVSISSGAGLTGGGTIAATRTLALDTASSRNVDHSAVSISSGAGLTGGGDITSSRTLTLDTASSLNVDHSAVSISPGNGLTGGGTIAATRTLTVGSGAGITVNTNDVALDTASSLNVDHSAVSISPGNGLTGGGTIEASRTLTVGAGTGISVTSTAVGLDTSNTRNVDHSGVSVSAGNGLTGGGTIAATRTLTLGTPATLTQGTSNGVTTSSHTHAIGAGIARFAAATGGAITVSTSDPSGTPADNDIWIKREA